MLASAIAIVRDNWLLRLVGQYPNGPLGGVCATLILSMLDARNTARTAALAMVTAAFGLVGGIAAIAAQMRFSSSVPSGSSGRSKSRRFFSK